MTLFLFLQVKQEKRQTLNSLTCGEEVSAVTLAGQREANVSSGLFFFFLLSFLLPPGSICCGGLRWQLDGILHLYHCNCEESETLKKHKQLRWEGMVWLIKHTCSPKQFPLVMSVHNMDETLSIKWSSLMHFIFLLLSIF